MHDGGFRLVIVPSLVKGIDNCEGREVLWRLSGEEHIFEQVLQRPFSGCSNKGSWTILCSRRAVIRRSTRHLKGYRATEGSGAEGSSGNRTVA
ncbi:hypothetical protein AMTR_s00083p00164040 [Amborella trichopoda]|uniref:Uncharacterized protein n=1 Tax=Amborella trichopoda TaxID=13333 RepID=W1NY26_AMBTC|nr:hypothetical protein AMTR_s00083p00164040 [Amborella trichopoda]